MMKIMPSPLPLDGEQGMLAATDFPCMHRPRKVVRLYMLWNYAYEHPLRPFLHPEINSGVQDSAKTHYE